MTEPVPLADALAAGYTQSPDEFAEQTTLGYVRVLRAIRGANGPGLGRECPRLPALRVKLPGSPPGYRMRPGEAEAWLQEVVEPWPLPADPIDSAQAIAILNGGTSLDAKSREYADVIARLTRSGVRIWRLLGQKRYSRAEIVKLASIANERGITASPMSQRDKGAYSVKTAGRISSAEAGKILGQLRKSGESLAAVTVTRLAPQIPGAVTVGHRWWFDAERLTQFVERLAAAGFVYHEPKRGSNGEVLGSNGGLVLTPCDVVGCKEVLKRSWAAVYEIRDGEVVERPVYCGPHAIVVRSAGVKAFHSRLTDALRSEGLEPVSKVARLIFRSPSHLDSVIPVARREFGSIVRRAVDAEDVLAVAPDGKARQRLAGPLNRALSAKRGTQFGAPAIDEKRPGTNARIIELHAAGRSYRSIGEELDVSKSHVERVVKAHPAAAVPKP